MVKYTIDRRHILININDYDYPSDRKLHRELLVGTKGTGLEEFLSIFLKMPVIYKCNMGSTKNIYIYPRNEGDSKARYSQ